MSIPQSLFRYDVAFIIRSVKLKREQGGEKKVDLVKACIYKGCNSNQIYQLNRILTCKTTAVETTVLNI